MNRIPVSLVVAVLVVIALILSLRFAPPLQLKSLTSAERVQQAPSLIAAQLKIHYGRPPIYDETYSMQDDNGVSSFQYTIGSASGPNREENVTIKAPPQATYAVSFFFGELVSDGVWDIPSRPIGGAPIPQYTVSVQQTETYHHGAYSATFTDPKYWAKTAGHEFEIHLSPKGPLPNILTLQGRGVHDPRYLQIVDDFRSFGPPEFRAAIARARARALTRTSFRSSE